MLQLLTIGVHASTQHRQQCRYVFKKTGLGSQDYLLILYIIAHLIPALLCSILQNDLKAKDLQPVQNSCKINLLERLLL